MENFSDSFWAMVTVVAPVFIIQVFQFLATLRNGKKADTAVTAAVAAQTEAKGARSELSEKIAENTALTHQATLSIKAAELMAKGAEQMGIEKERVRQSGFDGLRTDTVDITKGPP